MSNHKTLRKIILYLPIDTHRAYPSKLNERLLLKGQENPFEHASMTAER